jgi:ribosomal protein S18 acetylase RimI-like enzyme
MKRRSLPVPVRRATLEDVDALLALEHARFASDRMSRRAFRAAVVSPSRAVIVAAAASRPIASAIVSFRRGSATARLDSIAVARAFSGRGLGGRLLAACEAEARRRGARAMTLEVRRSNRAAVALYEKAGYERLARLADFYEDGAAALVYRKRLRTAARERT